MFRANLSPKGWLRWFDSIKEQQQIINLCARRSTIPHLTTRLFAHSIFIASLRAVSLRFRAVLSVSHRAVTVRDVLVLWIIFKSECWNLKYHAQWVAPQTLSDASKQMTSIDDDSRFRFFFIIFHFLALRLFKRWFSSSSILIHNFKTY